MGKTRIIIPQKLLVNLYFDRKFSFEKIAKSLKCSSPTIISRFKGYGLRVRKPREWLTKYEKKNFSGNELEKAYLLGFSVGDMSAYKPSKRGSVIVARCHTTQRNQADLIKSLFSEYGHVGVSHSKISGNRSSLQINCYLNDSFSFLLFSKPYHIEDWVGENFDNSTAFIAGYVDAEANFIINQGRARFKLDSYDFPVLSWIHQWCCRFKIKSKLRLISKKGSKRYGSESCWNNDLWRLNVNEAHSLLRFCNYLLPYLKHRKRIKNVNECVLNIEKRKKHGTV